MQYLGLHPHIFKHQLTQAASYYEQARSVASAATMLSPIAVGLGFGKWGGSSSSEADAGPSGSASTGAKGKGKGAAREPAPAPEPELAAAPPVQSFWNKPSTLYGLGAVALGAAAAGTAYYRREDFMNGWKWGFDHMTFVKNLWDDGGMKERLEALDTLERDRNIMFHKYARDPCPEGLRYPLTCSASTRTYRPDRRSTRRRAHSPYCHLPTTRHTHVGGTPATY